MSRRLLPIVVPVLVASGCSSVENAMGRKFTVKDDRPAAGERVMARAAYHRCTNLPSH